MKRRELVALAVLVIAPCSAADEGWTKALQAVQALRSITEAGVSYRDYAPRVLDAKILVDRYLAPRGGSADRFDIELAEAVGYFVLAGDVWSDRISGKKGSFFSKALGNAACIGEGLKGAEARAADEAATEIRKRRAERDAAMRRPTLLEREYRRRAEADPEFDLSMDAIIRESYVEAAIEQNIVPIIWGCAAKRLRNAEQRPR